MIFGADISSGNHDFAAFKAAGGDVLIISLGDGLGEQFANKRAPEYARKARAAGLRVGFYHYNRPRRLAQGNVGEEAAWMHELVQRAGGLKPGDPRIVIDIETDSGADAVDIAAFERVLRREVRARFGHEPLLYSFFDFSSRHFRGLGQDLWLAWDRGDKSVEQARARFSDTVRRAAFGCRIVGWQYQLDDSTTGLPSCDCNVFTDAIFIPGAPPPLPEEEIEMLMFWHGQAIFLDFHGRISPFGLHPDTVERLAAAGVRIAGRPGDDSELIRMFGTGDEAPPAAEYPIDFLLRLGVAEQYFESRAPVA